MILIIQNKSEQNNNHNNLSINRIKSKITILKLKINFLLNN